MKNLNILIQLTTQSIFSSLILLASQQISCCDKWHFILVALGELYRKWFLWLSTNNWRRFGGKSWSYRQVWTSKVSKKLSDFILCSLYVTSGMWKHFAEIQCMLDKIFSEFIVNVWLLRKAFHISPSWKSFWNAFLILPALVKESIWNRMF